MTATAALLLTIHCAATGAMTGIIWFVQIAHYPLLRAVGPDEFVAYEIENTRLTSYVVGPLMLIEAAAAVLIATVGVPGVSTGLAATGILLVLIIYGSTAIPSHVS